MGYFKISTRVYASRTPEYVTLYYKIQEGEHTLPTAVYTDCRLLRRYNFVCWDRSGYSVLQYISYTEYRRVAR